MLRRYFPLSLHSVQTLPHDRPKMFGVKGVSFFFFSFLFWTWGWRAIPPPNMIMRH